MNFREGMRRIGLTVGVIGALVTAYAAFVLFFADLAADRKVQAEFNSLLSLPIAQVVAKKIADNRTVSAYVEIQSHPEGIKQLWVDEKGEITRFEMDDGRTIMRTTEPSSVFWYLLYPPIVALGFVVPWGAIRLVTWIVSGFIRGDATEPKKA
jgi:hypothetical protein